MDDDSEKKTEAEQPVEAGEKRAAAKDTGGSTREKRARKTSTVFVPEDFSAIDRSVQIINGRGTTLGDIPAIVDSIESIKHASELETAHRLLYASKGKPSLKDMKSNILKFNGFLPKDQEGKNDEEKKAEDNKAETKMGQKAYKLKVSELKKVCDIFTVDRTKMNDKDSLVDALLDFLGCPDEKLLKQSKSAKAAAAKKQSSKVKSAAAGADDDILLSVEKGTMPSDAVLGKWVEAYVCCFDMESSTIKHAMQTASDKFGVDVSEKKALLKQLIAEHLARDD